MDTQESRIFHAVLVVCVLAGIMLFNFFNSMLRQYKRNHYLQKQNSIVEVSSAEQERCRIASDLHDDITSALAIAKMELGEITLGNEDDEFKKQSVVSAIDETIVRIREILLDLMPTMLMMKGLMAGIRQLIDKVTDSYPINISFVAVEEIEIPEQYVINIFRIVQESLHNAIRHSKATDIIILFEKNGSLLILKIADNGIGLNYNEQLKKSSGFGLRNLRKRIEVMGGQMYVESKKGKGLNYVFEIPLNDLQQLYG